MNIFVLDTDPALAAKYQCDRHVVKMVLEAGQILCTAVILNGGTAPYKATHVHHPCTKWAVQTRSNFDWLRRHGLALADEYTVRYGKVHKCRELILNLSNERIPAGELTPFAQAMPDQYKRADVVAAYRAYYKGAKSEMAAWKHGNIPSWWQEV